MLIWLTTDDAFMVLQGLSLAKIALAEEEVYLFISGPAWALWKKNLQEEGSLARELLKEPRCHILVCSATLTREGFSEEDQGKMDAPMGLGGVYSLMQRERNVVTL